MESLLTPLLPMIFLVGVSMAFLGIFYVIGNHIEKNHYQSILERERQLNHIPHIPSQDIDPDRALLDLGMVTGSVVISSDKFKRFAAGLLNLVGGRVSAYESLLDRARREAILRMKREAVNVYGADAIVNFRLETMSICGGTSGDKSMGIVEVLAYGTAVAYRPDRAQ